MQRLTLANINAEGINAWIMPDLFDLDVYEAGLTALPELPVAQFETLVSLDLSWNQIHELNVPAGYEQHEYLNLNHNVLDEILCTMILLLKSMGMTVQFANQNGQRPHESRVTGVARGDSPQGW